MSTDGRLFRSEDVHIGRIDRLPCKLCGRETDINRHLCEWCGQSAGLFKHFDPGTTLVECGRCQDHVDRLHGAPKHYGSWNPVCGRCYFELKRPPWAILSADDLPKPGEPLPAQVKAIETLS